MSLSLTLRNEILETLLNNSGGIPNVGDAGGVRVSVADGSLFLALHTADPGPSGVQNTSEATYTGYARKSVARNPSVKEWTVSSGQAVNANAQQFAQCTAGADVITHFSLGVASSGATKILARGAVGVATLPKPLTGATNDTLTAPGHGLAVNDRVAFFAVPGGSLPTGITAGTVYFVKTAPDADTFTISTTQGGATLDVTASGVGSVAKVVPMTISANVTPNFPASSLLLAMG